MMISTFDDLPLNRLSPPKEDRFSALVQCRADGASSPNRQLVNDSVRRGLNSPSRTLDPVIQSKMGTRFGTDFSRVRVHTDDSAGRSARAIRAQAYTVGRDIVFGNGRYAPKTTNGRELIAHELAHVVQQRGTDNSFASSELSIDTSGEAQADYAAQAVISGRPVASLGQVGEPAIQRRIEMRDVGRGEQSGFGRLPELIDRLDGISTGLTFATVGNALTYVVRPGGTLSGFDRQMMQFIDQDPVIPMRLTNRHGLLGSHATGFHNQVDVDAWTSGYVDIDDLLESTDLGLQSVLVHFLRERAATSNYAHRIGGSNFTNAEFNRVHSLGIEAEAELLRDYFGDPTIHIVNDSPSPTMRRVFRNSRRDLIRRRVRIGRGTERGIDAMSIDVRAHDGRTLTAEEYRRLLEEERIARQVERERLGGAAEHREGGRGVPAS